MEDNSLQQRNSSRQSNSSQIYLAVFFIYFLWMFKKNDGFADLGPFLTLSRIDEEKTPGKKTPHVTVNLIFNLIQSPSPV